MIEETIERRLDIKANKILGAFDDLYARDPELGYEFLIKHDYPGSGGEAYQAFLSDLFRLGFRASEERLDELASDLATYDRRKFVIHAFANCSLTEITVTSRDGTEALALAKRLLPTHYGHFVNRERRQVLYGGDY